MVRWAEEYRYEKHRGTYELAESFRFNGWDIRLYGDGRIRIGEKTYIGRYSSLQSDKNCEISIGKGCAISHNVRIYTTTYDPDQDFAAERKRTTGNVVIGDNVWIGANVFIPPGVTIGENSVVGANSVVTHDVEAMSIVGGVPARLIRRKRLAEKHSDIIT